MGVKFGKIEINTTTHDNGWKNNEKKRFLFSFLIMILHQTTQRISICQKKMKELWLPTQNGSKIGKNGIFFNFQKIFIAKVQVLAGSFLY